jgi:hypothetical protein
VYTPDQGKNQVTDRWKRRGIKPRVFAASRSRFAHPGSNAASRGARQAVGETPKPFAPYAVEQQLSNLSRTGQFYEDRTGTPHRQRRDDRRRRNGRAKGRIQQIGP